MHDLDRIRRFHLLMTMITILIVSCEIIYTVSCRRLVEQYARYSVEQNAEEISKQVDVYIDSAFDTIQLTSQLVSEKVSVPDRNEIAAVIDTFAEKTSFDHLEFTDVNGITQTYGGECTDVSGKVFFKNGMSGETGIWIDYSTGNSDEYIITFYTPFYCENKISGVITGSFGADSKILPMLVTSFYGEPMIGILCDSNQQVISATINIEDEISLTDVLNDLTVSEEGQKSISKRVETDSLRSVFSYSTTNGKAIACIETNESTGWKIIQIVPPDSFLQAIVRYTIVGYCTAAAICFLLILYMIHVRMDANRKERELVREKDMAVHNFEQILLTTAADTYRAIRKVDLESSVSDYMYFEDGHFKQKEVGHWDEWIEKQRENTNPDDFARVTQTLSTEHLRSLEEGASCRETYRSVNEASNGYCKYFTTTASITNIDDKKTAIVTTIENTDAVVKELEQKKLLASSASIYISMHAVDIRNDTMISLNCPEYISEIIGDRKSDVAGILYDVMEHLTDIEFWEDMKNFIDFKTLDDRMKDTNTITFEFVSKRSGWCRARFIASEYDERKKLRGVLWVVENIDTEKKKSRQLQYLSETDLMTGIKNRGSGEKKIKEYLAEGKQGMFCLLDADKFKSINDNFGHAVGDKVLIAIAGCLKESFRDTDVVMRLGGDEFAIFAVGVTDKTAAVSLIERFFYRIEHISIPEIGDRRISVSLGAAIRLEEDGWNFETLYSNADSCTYISKKTQGCAYTFFGESNN